MSSYMYDFDHLGNQKFYTVIFMVISKQNRKVFPEGIALPHVQLFSIKQVKKINF